MHHLARRAEANMSVMLAFLPRDRGTVTLASPQGIVKSIFTKCEIDVAASGQTSGMMRLMQE